MQQPKNNYSTINDQLPTRRIQAGLSWPEQGHPGFVCVVRELSPAADPTITFDSSPSSMEIALERQGVSMLSLMAGLVELPRLNCHDVFAPVDSRYATYFRDFNAWRRRGNVPLRLKPTRSSSFEASVLKLAECIEGDRLKFPKDSVVKEQLRKFSKTNFRDEVEFFAVRALTMVIGEFDQRPASAPLPGVDQKAWW